jgi:uncharacterized alpha-E superfamily protein
MMLARVADSLYWLGRYIERAEHSARLADVMLNASLDLTDTAGQTSEIVLQAIFNKSEVPSANPMADAQRITLDRHSSESVLVSLSRARENARQVRDQLTTETWERLNLLYLRTTADAAVAQFNTAPAPFLHDIIADLHLFKGAADSTMSHGEGWRFLLLGIHIERTQLIARLLEVALGPARQEMASDHLSQMNLLRMSCALEPYLRVYTAELQPHNILQFLVFDPDFPRSIRFSTTRIEEHLIDLCRSTGQMSRLSPDRIAGRLKSSLEFADLESPSDSATTSLLSTVVEECVRIHDAIFETFTAYPLELRLPA